MRTILLILATTTLIIAGCASFQEAYYTDQSLGEGNQETWQAQIAYPDRPYAEKTPEEIAGITAEEIMEVHNNTFGTPPQRAIDIFDFSLGSGGSGGQ